MTLNLRITPELIYAPDRSGEHGARIATLLNQIRKEDEERAARTDAESNAKGEEVGSDTEEEK